MTIYRQCAVCGMLTNASFRDIPVCEQPYREHKLLVTKDKFCGKINGYRLLGRDDEACVYVEERFNCDCEYKV